MVRNILFITLSNIGDAVLSLPALDFLRHHFPQARLTVISGERTKEIFEGDPRINKFIVYNKHVKFREKIKLFFELRKEKFDLIADLRNSLLGAALTAKYKISPLLRVPKHIKHMKDRHLYKIQSLLKIKDPLLSRGSLYPSPVCMDRINLMLKDNNINEDDDLIIISAGARSHTKRWSKEKFVGLITRLVDKFPAKIILVGDAQDAVINKYIAEHIAVPVLDLSAKTTLLELTHLLKRASLLIGNDSATTHIASYLNIPVVAIFGISDDRKYGPWSANCLVVKKEISCRPCVKAQCRFGTLECMSIVKVEDVFRQANNLLNRKREVLGHPHNYKRILLIRTDRIGDVLLSTPVIKAVRDYYPHAYIAMMVSPYARQIVEGNPYLDEVIIYDKDDRHKNWSGAIKFIRGLRKKRFDLSLILHPTNRVHLITFLAGIPKRVGYDRKLSFLLTDRIRHIKQLGEKHESEYALDLVRYLGIEPKDKDLFMPIKPESEKWVMELFKHEGISMADKLLAIHPGASCLSKIWPVERFAEAGYRLSQKYGFKILIVAGPKDLKYTQDLVKHMQLPVINLAGKASVTQLASLLKRCALFISNDSGPVHIASSLGTPVISIFGRNQAGLSPKRWGPLGLKDKFLRKEAGCIECLAHNCVKQFACLKAITVEDVVSAAESILEN